MTNLSFNSFVTRVATLLTLLVFSVALVSAQVTTGVLQGVVRDPNGAAVAGAPVKVTNTETGISRDTTTNDEGFYRVTNLTPGRRYSIEVSASGFAPARTENVAVNIATENSVDITVGVAQVGETVQVVGEATLINTTQNQLTQNYTPQQLTQLPYTGSIDNLALLTPGVVTPGDADFTNGVGISANGNRARSNNFQIDGQDNNDNSVAGPTLGFTNQDAIGEYQVITNNFSAEFGRNSGAQVNVVTKAGTNEFHGTAFEFHNNSALDSKNNIDERQERIFNFLNNNGFTQANQFLGRFPNPYKENRFGGSIGGPVVKNKAFFFGTYQGDYTRGDAIVSNLGGGTYLLTPASAAFAAARFPNAATASLISSGRPGGPTTAGDGSGSLVLLPPTEDVNGDGVPDRFTFGPGGSGASFTGVTPGFLAPLAVVSTTAGGSGLTTLFGGEAVRTRRNDGTSHQFIGRTDYNLTDRDLIVARFIADRNRFPLGAGGSSIAGSLQDYRDRTYNFGVTYTRTISPSTVNEARFNYQNLFVAFGDTSAQPGTALPSIGFSGSANLVGSGQLGFGNDNVFPQDRSVKVYQVQDTVSTTRGNHALKFGADIRRQNLSTFFLPDFLGRFGFAGSFTSASTAGTNPAGTFFDVDNSSRAGLPSTALENFLLGRPRTINFTLGNPQIITHENDMYLFVQDDWRIRPTLTLNLGLRYELSSQPFNPLIDRLNTREGDSSTAIFPTTFPVSTRTFGEVKADKNNFAPRVGFAWSPNFNFGGERFRSGRTVIRGGFGIAYDPSFFNIVLNTVTSSPFVVRGTFQQTPGASGSVTYPFLPSTPAQAATTPGTNGGDPRLFSRTLVDPNLYNPYTMSFNFGIQQEIFRNTVVEARYVGSRIVGQFQSLNANPNIRLLNLAGQLISGNPGQFTNGVLLGSCVGTDPTCITPTAANGFQNRTSAASAGNGRVDPNFGPVQIRTNGASSTYNGGQFRFETRLNNDLTALVTYSISKTIDNTSEIFGTLAGGQFDPRPERPFDDNRLERGLSAFHQKHIFTASYVWNIPFMKDQHGWAGKALGGWQLNGIIRAGSGRPYSPGNFFGRYDPNVASFDRPFVGNPNAPQGTIAFGRFTMENIFGYTDAQTGTANASPFIIFDTRQPGQVGTPASNTQVLQNAQLVYNDFGILPSFFGNASAATFNAFAPALEAFNLFKTPFGDLGRNTFTGLPTYQVNMGLFKNFKMGETRNLQIRAEAINLLNRRNFGVPDVITEDAFAGPEFRTSSFLNPGFNSGSSRSVRLGLRFEF